MATKTDVCDLLGGPAAPLGLTTAGEFCDAMEEALEHLTSPGSRVYLPEQNRSFFWTRLHESLLGSP